MAYIPTDKTLLGMPTVGRPVTATLYVSPNGDNSNGRSWEKAYNTIQGALDAASTDADDSTAILIAPHATFYDINTTGDPTWTGNYEICGTHRIWAAVKNTHASATSVFKFTGKVSICDLAIFTDSTNNADGVIFTSNGWRLRQCGFNSSGTDGASTSVYIDGSAALTRGGIMEDVQFIGHVTHTKAIYINTSTVNEIYNVSMHDCLVGIHITNAASDINAFHGVDIGDCALGIDIDSGNEQHFDGISFHHNTLNIDDEVGDHHWSNINGQFAITAEPDNFTGVAVDTGDGADTWTAAPVEVRAAATSTKPFKIVGVNLESGTSEKYRLRLSADNGTTWFDDFQFDDTKSQALSFGAGTEYIFNAGTQITAESKSESAGIDELDIWLKIQEI